MPTASALVTLAMQLLHKSGGVVPCNRVAVSTTDFLPLAAAGTAQLSGLFSAAKATPPKPAASQQLCSAASTRPAAAAIPVSSSLSSKPAPTLTSIASLFCATPLRDVPPDALSKHARSQAHAAPASQAAAPVYNAPHAAWAAECAVACKPHSNPTEGLARPSEGADASLLSKWVSQADSTARLRAQQPSERSAHNSWAAPTPPAMLHATPGAASLLSVRTVAVLVQPAGSVPVGQQRSSPPDVDAPVAPRTRADVAYSGLPGACPPSPAQPTEGECWLASALRATECAEARPAEAAAGLAAVQRPAPPRSSHNWVLPRMCAAPDESANELEELLRSDGIHDASEAAGGIGQGQERAAAGHRWAATANTARRGVCEHDGFTVADEHAECRGAHDNRAPGLDGTSAPAPLAAVLSDARVSGHDTPAIDFDVDGVAAAEQRHIMHLIQMQSRGKAQPGVAQVQAAKRSGGRDASGGAKKQKSLKSLFG